MSCGHGHDCGCGGIGAWDRRAEADPQGWWRPRGWPRRPSLAVRPEETVASLEAYLDELRAEAREVDERLHALCRAEEGHWPRRPGAHAARTSHLTTHPAGDSDRPPRPHDGGERIAP